MTSKYQFMFRGKIYECIGDNRDFQIDQFNFAIESKQWSVVEDRVNNQLMWGPLLKEVNEEKNT